MRTADTYVHNRIQTSLARAGVKPWKGQTVAAYLNHGRWLADCPCNGAELVAPDLPMVCGSCGAEHQVVFPTDRERIETILNKRPVLNQNWLPDETVGELEAQNIERGIW